MADSKNTAPHKVWGGTLAFGLVSVPVALFAAAREEKISFNQLHATCMDRLKQPPMTCPTCKVSVEKTEIVKGYEHAKNQYVTVTKQEIEAAEPDSSRTLEITDFVPAESVDSVYLESSFYLALDEDAGRKPYALIVQAMQLKGMVAIAKLTYSGKEHVCLIRPIVRGSETGLMLHTLFWGYEVRSFAFAALPQVSDAELSIACQLVDALRSDFDPARYSDGYRANMLELIEQKKSGAVVAVLPTPAKKEPVADISAALFASIQNAKASRTVASGRTA